MKKHKQAGIVPIVLVLVAIFSAFAIAGDLEPSAAPAPTMHSLEDIYNLVENINAMVDPAPCGPCDPTGAGAAKTGQTTSYATGDDGDLEKGIASPAPRFTDNGDGTVTDNLTGLIWLKNANRFGARAWIQALGDCNNLADDGENLTDGSVAGDWRLPNVKELQSLIDFGRYSPALPPGHPFSDGLSNYYWSSTSAAYSTGNAWQVGMNLGGVYQTGKGTSCFVWPVRGGN